MKKYQWLFVFLLIVALTQSNSFIAYQSQPGWLGFPQWIWWFMLFHVLFIIALYFFVQQSNRS